MALNGHAYNEWVVRMEGLTVGQSILYNIASGRRVISLNRNHYFDKRTRHYRLGRHEDVKRDLNTLCDAFAINIERGDWGEHKATRLYEGQHFNAFLNLLNVPKAGRVTPADKGRLELALEAMDSDEGRQAVNYIWQVRYEVKSDAPRFPLHDRIAAVRAWKNVGRGSQRTAIPGRMYDGGLSVQGLRRGYRRYVRMCLGDKKYDTLKEVDFSALHYNLLYAKYLKRPCPGDPYCMVAEILGVGRDVVKQPMVIIANTKSKRACSEALCGYFKTLPSPPPFTERQIMEATELAHQGIEKHLYKSNWMDLHRLDCDLLIKIVNRLGERGIPMAPLHDAVIVPWQFGAVSRDIMVEEANRMLGVELPVKIKPIGSVEAACDQDADIEPAWLVSHRGMS